MLKRTIAGLIMAVLLGAILYLGGWYIRAASILMALLCEYEILATMKKGGVKTMDAAAYLFSAALFPAFYFFGMEGVFLAYALFVAVLFILRALSRRYDFISVAHTAFTGLYPQLLIVYLYQIACLKDGRLALLMILLALAAASGSDVFAYFTGSLFGKHKLAPALSPNKTVEGAVGGVAGGVLCTLAVVLIFGETQCPLYVYLLAGAVLAVLSQFGDLASSMIKRHFGVKDFGSLIPGHGGMLDRVCSIIFILPVIFLFFRLFYGI